MKPEDVTRKLLAEHCLAYPKLQIRDVFKFLYQSAFGCEHSVSSLERVREGIAEEYSRASKAEKLPIEPLDGQYLRVPLSYMEKGLCAETLARLFFYSARKEENAAAELEKKLAVALDMSKKGQLPFSALALEEEISAWREQGFPAVRHSELFREEYRPSYRVISKRFTPFLPLFAELDRRLAKGSLRVAIEGGSASGKSTLGDLISKVYDCTLFHMDDFFLRPEQRTPERFAEAGGNIDRERFEAEVLLPLSRGETVKYRKFDCSRMELGNIITVPSSGMTVVEGVYSLHPELAGYYDFKVFLDITEEAQKARIEKRNSPEMAKRFFSEWIPLEKRYFSEMNVPEKCDLVIKIEK